MTIRTRLAVFAAAVVILGGLITGGISAMVSRDSGLSLVEGVVDDALDIVRADPQRDASGLISFADSSPVPVSAELFFDEGSPVSLVDGRDKEGLVAIGQLTPSQIARAVGGFVHRNSPTPAIIRALPTDDGEWVVVAASTREVQQAFKDSLLRSVQVSFVVALLVAFLVWLLISRTLRPVSLITDRATAIASGNLEVELPVAKGRNEIARLTNALATMVTSLRAALEVRAQSEERMRAFLGDASHELRTPLTVVRGYIEMLHSGHEMSDEQNRRAIRRLVAESKRMSVMIDDLLMLAELDEIGSISMSDVDLSTIVAEHAGDLAEQHPQRRVEISVSPGVVIRGNAPYLERAVQNVVANVVRHTPESAAVRIELSSTNEYAVVTFDDSGPGLSEEMYGRCSDGFRRFDLARSQEDGGFGLGLSIIASIVEEHRGSLSMVPSPLGGLRTILKFPLLS